MIDARQHHHPETAAVLIDRAAMKAGSMAQLAIRMGVHKSTLQRIRSGDNGMRYPIQVTLEAICNDKPEGRS